MISSGSFFSETYKQAIHKELKTLWRVGGEVCMCVYV